MNYLFKKNTSSEFNYLIPKRILFILMTTTVLSAAWVSFPAYSYDNKLFPGDVISITVYGESELSIRDIRISDSGIISYPLIGSLSLNGKTTNQLEKEIVSKLKKGFLKRPRVSVVIQQYRPFFVNGQVGSPGAFPYVLGLTIRKAFAIAGGLTDRASNKKIFLIKEHNRTKKIPVKDWDVDMQPGDILIVGESLF